ncbi:hypothetical protein PHMEG_0004319 [Phytophthora megakarya]|uniref:Uncharacterized protein n=1 Tax=Phytophthora megakarya TaxID=4795 RepID=A0A225WU56_9STRA|nr:hypothetical protein PHMEG_0004319 [Phytophthora megakarya]
MFVVSEDGVWLSLNVQLAKLALVSMDPSVSDETNGLFTMKVVKNLTEWHAGVTAACYDSESATLVVSGGVRDPSVDLIEKQASSLSVWKVVGEKDTKDVGELLDFTMVVKGKKQQVSDEAIEDDQSDLVSVVEEESGGLLASMLSQSPSALLKEIGLSRLSEMQTTVNESVVNGNDAHSASVVVSVRLDAAKWHFGHYVKAVWSALLAKHKLDESVDAQRVFEVPSSDILDHFTAIFEELLSFVELCASDDNPKALKFAEMATVALSNLLVRHDELGGVAERSAMAWQDEQKRAVKSRIQAQFQVGAAIEKKASHQSDQESSCWSALFARGVWGVRLLNWYTEHAYAELSREEEITEAVILVHWEANNLDLAIQLLLMCPFDGLREKNPPLWTSSGNYVVCALVAQGEFAAAGRLTCALRHAHPLLWDMENARLLLANYLRSLASSEQQKSKNIKDEIAHLQHEVYAKTSRRFADALL